jgi:hypothetical protein
MNAKMDANQAKASKQDEMLAEISARMDINLNKMRVKQKLDPQFVHSGLS